MEERKADALTILAAVHLTPQIPEHAPRSDQEFMRILKEGEEEENLDKIYQFVNAVERGIGFQKQELAEMMVNGFAVSPEQVMQILVGKRFWEQCAFLASGTDQMRKEFVAMGAAGNMRFLYECLRQILRYDKKDEKMSEIMVQGLVMLSDNDESLWKRWIRTFEYDKKWISLLGDVLPCLHEAALTVYAQTIRMDLSEDRTGVIDQELDRVPPEAMERILRSVAGPLYQRWKAYLHGMKKEKNGLHEMKFGGYIDLIFLSVMHLCQDSETWEKEISEVASDLQSAMTEWYPDVVRMETVFFAQVSQLYLLLYAGRELKKKPDAQLIKLLLATEKQLYMQEYFWKADKAGEYAQRESLYQLIASFTSAAALPPS